MSESCKWIVGRRMTPTGSSRHGINAGIADVQIAEGEASAQLMAKSVQSVTRRITLHESASQDGEQMQNSSNKIFSEHSV